MWIATNPCNKYIKSKLTYLDATLLQFYLKINYKDILFKKVLLKYP